MFEIHFEVDLCRFILLDVTSVFQRLLFIGVLFKFSNCWVNISLKDHFKYKTENQVTLVGFYLYNLRAFDDANKQTRANSRSPALETLLW